MAAETLKQPFGTLNKPVFFDILAQEACDSEARLGSLSIPGRTVIHTPHYVALSSRGVVPHLTQDMMADNTAIQGIYAALEDCE